MNKLNRLSKKISDVNEKTDRWVISYADFITLLFAFFVTLYAISSVNEQKYKVAADSLGMAFLKTPQLAYPVLGTSYNATQVTVNNKNNGQLGKGALTPHVLSKPSVFTDDEIKQIEKLVEQGLIDVKDTPNWFEITLKSSVLFSSGSATLLPDAKNVLLPLRNLFAKIKTPIQVEGFTDNVPIYNQLFPSNWELSAARAAAVVRTFIELKLPRNQFIVVGYGSNFPVASNKTLIGRELNRRVVMIVSKNERIARLQKNTYIEKDVLMSQQQRQQNILNQRAGTVRPLQLDDGRIRYTTIPERQSAGEIIEN